MVNESGVGVGSSYEYVVAERRSASVIFKRIALVAFYVLWSFFLLIVGVVTRLAAPFLAFIPITVWILVFFTWRLTQVEYEIAFFSGTLTVCRILGGRSRKVLAEVTIRELSGVYPYEDPYTARVDSFVPNKEIFAISDANAPELYAALWKDGDGKAWRLWFEPTEKALKILRYYNASAVTIKKNPKTQEEIKP